MAYGCAVEGLSRRPGFATSLGESRQSFPSILPFQSAMSRGGEVERGFEALEKGKALEKAGKVREAVVHFNEGIVHFQRALRSPDLSASDQDAVKESVEFFQKRIQEVEEGLQKGSGWEDLLPEAPSTVPTGTRTSRGSASQMAEEESRGRRLLVAALDLEEQMGKSGRASVQEKKKAVEHYMQAIESLLSAVKLEGANSEKGKALTRMVEDALSRAEALKSPGNVTASSRSGPLRPAPPRSPTRPSEGDLLPQEVAVLKDSSIINGKLFLPWMKEDLQETYRFSRRWTDPDGLLPLSPIQRESLVGWKRPSEVIQGDLRMIAERVDPLNIKQDVITDCSFVASLCIASAMESRVHKRLITGIIYPQDSRGRPVYNPDGKYVVKLTVNGVARKVVVDDLLPMGRNNRLLCSASIDHNELWVSIVEKAYLKVNGGYDFPGGNSGVDLFALTGWLPEQIFFEETREAKDSSGRSTGRPRPLDNYETKHRVWERLVSAHEFGDCLITVATGPIPEDEAQKLGLVPDHAYAVLDVKHVLGIQLLLVKNPWSRKRWLGNYSAHDTKRWTPELKAALKVVLDEADSKATRQSGASGGGAASVDHVAVRRKAAEQADNGGVFWIDFDSIFKYFNNMFLNWNPGLFSCRSVLHSRWPSSQGPQNDTYNLGYNPQFSLVVKAGSAYGAAGSQGGSSKPGGSHSALTAHSRSPSVWVLLTRHVTRLERDPSEGDFLTMHVFAGTQGKRVYYPDDPMFRGIYTNNQHTIIRFDLPDDTKPGAEVAYTLVVSQYVKKRDVSFTVNVYCTAMFRLYATPLMPEHRHSMTGVWERHTAGGALGRANYFLNPQYAMVLSHPKTRIHIQLEAPRDYSVNVNIVSAGGQRVDVVSKDLEALNTGSYRPGFCFAEGLLKAGTYTVIVSTFKAGQEGGYRLIVATSSRIKAPTRIPAEGEGMAKQVISGRWTEKYGTAAGCANFGRYLENPRYLVKISSRTSLLLRIALPERAGPFPTGRPAVNVTLYRSIAEVVTEDSKPSGERGEGADHRLEGSRGNLDPRCKPNSELAIVSSNAGVYMESRGGATTARFEADPGDYVAVPSTFAPHETDFVLTVYSAPALPELEHVR